MAEREKYPSEAAERFQVRLPAGLRDRIRIAADGNGRSMNTEIVATLEAAYPTPDPMEAAMRAFADILQRRRLGTNLPGEYEALPDFLRRIVEETEADETPEERAEAVERARAGFATKVEKVGGGYRAVLPTPVKVRRRKATESPE